MGCRKARRALDGKRYDQGSGSNITNVKSDKIGHIDQGAAATAQQQCFVAIRLDEKRKGGMIQGDKSSR